MNPVSSGSVRFIWFYFAGEVYSDLRNRNLRLASRSWWQFHFRELRLKKEKGSLINDVTDMLICVTHMCFVVTKYLIPVVSHFWTVDSTDNNNSDNKSSINYISNINNNSIRNRGVINSSTINNNSNGPPGSQQPAHRPHHLWQQQTAMMPVRRPTVSMTVPNPPNCGGVKQTV